MPTEHILALLVAERDKLNRAIEALGGTIPKRRGRPPRNPLTNAPSWVTGKPETDGKPKRIVSAAARKRMAVAQRKRWTAKRAAVGK